MQLHPSKLYRQPLDRFAHIQASCLVLFCSCPPPSRPLTLPIDCSSLPFQAPANEPTNQKHPSTKLNWLAADNGRSNLEPARQVPSLILAPSTRYCTTLLNSSTVLGPALPSPWSASRSPTGSNPIPIAQPTLVAQVRIQVQA